MILVDSSESSLTPIALRRASTGIMLSGLLAEEIFYRLAPKVWCGLTESHTCHYISDLGDVLAQWHSTVKTSVPFYLLPVPVIKRPEYHFSCQGHI